MYSQIEQRREYARKWIARRRADFFRGKRCVHCGSSSGLQLDHIDPATKIAHGIWSWSDARRAAEIAKCQVLCHPCHVIKTNEQTYPPRKHGTILMYQKEKCRCTACRRASADTRLRQLRVQRGRSE